MKETYLDYHFNNMYPETKWLFVTPSLESRALRVQVQEVGRFIYDSGAYTERGPLESYQIALSNTASVQKFSVAGVEYPELDGKQITLLDCRKGYRSESYGKHDDLFVHFWSEDMGYYADLYKSLNGGSPCIQTTNQLIYENLSMLLKIYSQPNDYQTDLLAESLIMQMVHEFIRVVTPVHSGQYSEYVQKAIQVILDQYGERLTLDDLARRVHISKYYLSHIFKEETGLTPANYLQQTRLNKAKELLRTTGMSQEEICAQVGLYNCSYLSRLFRAHENLTPDQYRKKWK